jgi:hypothetical protein
LFCWITVNASARGWDALWLLLSNTLRAVYMTAGHNALRGSGPNH